MLPIKGVAFTFNHPGLRSQSSAGNQADPTLEAGDVMLSKDGEDFANLTTLPVVVDESSVLVVSLSATEMDCDRIAIRFSDVVGNEWFDAVTTFNTQGTSSVDLSSIEGLLSEGIIRVNQTSFVAGYVAVHRDADYDDVSHPKRKWLIDHNEVDLTGFTTGELVLCHKHSTQTLTLDDVTVVNPGAEGQAVHLAIDKADLTTLDKGRLWTFKFTLTNGTVNFVVDAGEFETLS